MPQPAEDEVQTCLSIEVFWLGHVGWSLMSYETSSRRPCMQNPEFIRQINFGPELMWFNLIDRDWMTDVRVLNRIM